MKAVPGILPSVADRVSGRVPLWVAGLALACLLFDVGVVPAAAESFTNTPAPEELMTQLRSRLADAELELGTLGAAQAGSTNRFPGATPAETIEYQLVLQSLVRAYQRELDDLVGMEALNQRHRDLLEAIKSWTGFAEPPPYSILFVDSLRDSVQSLSTSIEMAQTTCNILEGLSAEARQLLERSDARLRALHEEIETASEPARRTELTWQRTFELARNRLAAANLAGFERRRRRFTGEIADNRQRLDFARHQLALASRHVRFSTADWDKVLAGLDTNRLQLEREQQTAEQTSQAAERALASVREELHQALTQQPRSATNAGTSTAAIAKLQQVTGLRTVQAETANQRLNLARQLLDLSVYERALWQTRFSTFGSTDLTALNLGYRRLETMRRLLQMAKPYFLRQLELAARQISEEQESLEDRPDTLRDPAVTRERLASFTERETFFRAGLRSLEKAERLLLRWKESLDQDRLALPLSGRVRDLFSEFSTFATKLWSFELLAAEDTITVDGQVISGRRSVTVSKVAKAVLILVAGYWIATLLGRLLERAAVRRLKIEPNQANLIRRWARFLFVAILIVLSLVWVKIPLTVFAFLGGALAIGLGFGTQNLLKNFISGIIILFERPFRVGDVIQAGGQRGTVTGIGIRSSILQISDGTETLIPNSVLLETSLTNWTYSNRRVRSSLTVVVAGDSDTRRVAQLLAETADRHGLILKEPRPTILFKDFEDGGFAFEIRYWLEVGKQSAAQVASDLRHMIAVAFAENRIAFSAPSTDSHGESGSTRANTGLRPSAEREQARSGAP